MLQDTSLKAWYELQSSLGEKQKSVLDEIRREPGTCAEIAHRLGWEMHQVSGRLTELKALKMVEEAHYPDGRPIILNRGHVIQATSPLPPAFAPKPVEQPKLL